MEVNTTLSGRNFIDLRILTQKLLSSANRSQQILDNETELVSEEDLDVNTDIYSKVFVTVIYVLLFVIGCLGNSITLYTLLTKKSLQNLQSTVHYHLASLAISDLLILILCMPIELYNFIWVHHPWAFGEAVCKGYYFLRDGCSYATAFNIASLSVERFMAICHPFKAKSIMSRSRTKKLISAMWLASFLLATPMLFTMGQRLMKDEFICTTIVSSITAKTVLQGAVVSSVPLRKRRIVERSVQVFPAGSPFQGTSLTVHPKSVATLGPPQKAWGQGQATQPKSLWGITDLRTVIITKKASKRS
ncbi:Neurotensin receptor type 1 [Anabarilius grahami]|uniref:Neurotensin receptor type 1 n=1 Tax=Anabarilius grahami TaxID=495550 RepID=A0A3N0Y167_ANAGA|nr:Neurotensin receptor type 1 [Anabarilius grahami]